MPVNFNRQFLCWNYISTYFPQRIRHSHNFCRNAMNQVVHVCPSLTDEKIIRGFILGNLKSFENITLHLQLLVTRDNILRNIWQTMTIFENIGFFDISVNVLNIDFRIKFILWNMRDVLSKNDTTIKSNLWTSTKLSLIDST